MATASLIGTPAFPALGAIAFPSLCSAFLGSAAKKDEKIAREFLMNVGIRKSNAFNKFLQTKGISGKTQEEAIEYCLKKSAPILGGFKEFQKEMPDAVQKIVRATSEADLPYYRTPGVLRNELMQKHMVKRGTAGGIIQGVKNILTGEEKIVQKLAEEELAKQGIALETKTATRTLAEATAEVSSKRLAEEVAEKTAVSIPKIAQNTVSVAKSTAQKAGRLPLSKKVVEKIGTETMKKTGAKLATMATLKMGAKKIPIIGALFGAGFAINRALNNDWTGAGMEFASGVVSCFPGFGTVASIGIDGALIAKDMAGGR